MCDIWKRTDQTQLHSTELERHRESLRTLGVKWVVLTGGEPLLNNDFNGICTFFRQEGIRLTLLTSGLLLKRFAREVAVHIDDVIVSLDGPESVHDQIRGVAGAYKSISDGIGALRSVRPDMRISGRCTVQKANHSALRQTVSAAKEIGLNSISFLAADLISEAFNRLSVWPADRQSAIALNEMEVLAVENELERLIAEHKEDILSHYIAESPAKLRRILNHFRAHLGFASPEAPICNAPFVSAVVEANGTVRPCFFHRPIGDLRHAQLEDIINGPEALTFRRELSIHDDPICRKCVCSLNHRR
jgi:MoaA/NifB/PqqE/SkfB family radical SAM enzyme